MNLDESRIGYHPKRVADWQAERKIGPIYVELSPTNVCNHKCSFCAYRHLKADKQEWDIQHAMAVPKGLADAGVKSVMIAGEGEPCLYPHIGTLVKALASWDIRVAITTNGSQDMQDYAKYCDWIRVSFNGSTAEEYKYLHGVYGFDTALHNTMNICGLTKTQMQMVYVGQDIDNLVKLIRTVDKAGVRTFQIKQYNAMEAQSDHPAVAPLTADDISKLEAASGDLKVVIRSGLESECKREYGACYALDFMCEILSNYDINGCQVMKGNPDYTWGNVLDKPFDEVWFGSADKRRAISLSSPNRRCMDRCRPHQNNKWLWNLKTNEKWNDYI